MMYVLPLLGGFASTDLYIPAVGRVEGVGGSQFYTTLWITNPSPTKFVDIQIQFLPAGQTNPTPVTFNDRLAPRETKVYENFVESLFGIRGILGGARVRSSEDILVSSRIYNQFPGEPIANTQGLGFSAVPGSFGIAREERSRLQGVTQNPDFRYNFFFLEVAGRSVTLHFDLLDKLGATVAAADYQVLPYEQRLISLATIFPNRTIDGGVLEATVTAGEGRIILAGSLVANRSQDASYFEMSFKLPAAIPGPVGPTGPTGATGTRGLEGTPGEAGAQGTPGNSTGPVSAK